MSTTNASVWDTLSAVNVNNKIEKKGQLSYLSWAWAWGEVKKRYPDVNYKFQQPVFFGDGSCEVWCSVTIGDITHEMWLPVMDNRNKAVPNPDARAISDARMRCLTKCLAIHGLGHYIYAGEDIPDPDAVSKSINSKYQASIDAIKAGIESGDLSSAAEAWFELGDKEKQELWVAESKGGAFTAQERAVMQTQEFRESHFGVENG